MKRLICVILALVSVLSLAACGAEEPQQTQPVTQEPAGEETLSPREQFEQMKEAMDELQNGNTGSDDGNGDAEAESGTAVTYTTNGITYTLDSSFTSGNEAANNFQHKYTSDAIWFTEQICANDFGLYTSRELAEAIAAQGGKGVVGSANGVYYIEDADKATVKAYYVDDSGYYWILFGFVTNRYDYNSCRDQLIAFCTSGELN